MQYELLKCIQPLAKAGRNMNILAGLTSRQPETIKLFNKEIHAQW